MVHTTANSAKLVHTTANSAKFVELVPHPCGLKFGAFPLHESFTLSEGRLDYNTGYPQNEVFHEDPTNTYVFYERKEEALDKLRTELAKAKRTVEDLEALVAAAESAVQFRVLFEGKLWAGK